MHCIFFVRFVWVCLNRFLFHSLSGGFHFYYCYLLLLCTHLYIQFSFHFRCRFGLVATTTYNLQATTDMNGMYMRSIRWKTKQKDEKNSVSFRRNIYVKSVVRVFERSIRCTHLQMCACLCMAKVKVKSNTECWW